MKSLHVRLESSEKRIHHAWNGDHLGQTEQAKVFLVELCRDPMPLRVLMCAHYVTETIILVSQEQKGVL